MSNYAETIKARGNLITLMLREDHQKIRQLFDQFHERRINTRNGTS